MANIMDDRYFQNPYISEERQNNFENLITKDGKLNGNIDTEIAEFLSIYKEKLASKLTDRWVDISDGSLYTGITGIALYFWKNFDHFTGSEKDKEIFLELLRKSTRSLKKKRKSFLCGDSGPLVLLYLYNDRNEIESNNIDKYFDDLLSLMPNSDNEEIPNELLFGRAGYLFALLFVKANADKIESGHVLRLENAILQVCRDIIQRGVTGAEQERHKSPLFFEWHQKEYIGAAHGYIGIYYVLLQAKILVPNSINNERMEMIRICLDRILDEQVFPHSGNVKSSVGSDQDRLVHWCHGAPGAVHLYALASQVFDDQKYLSAARRFADVVWERGLLRKGYSLCHGVAGNGYALLAMYQVTGEQMYLWRAIKFAEWCLGYGSRKCPRANRPYSLFEGLAGTLYFLLDIRLPMKAKFPAFQLLSYRQPRDTTRDMTMSSAMPSPPDNKRSKFNAVDDGGD